MFLFLLFLVYVESFKDGCETVKKGSFYHEHHALIPGIVDKKVYSAYVNFHKNMSRYLFPSDYEKGVYCSHSWNKLFGKSRCGHLHHVDSDRFVFRRTFSCLLTNGSYVIGEKKDCPDLDFLEIAAYSYVDGAKPFQHQGVLLKEFKMKLEIEKWHFIQLTDYGNYTEYYVKSEDGKEERIDIVTRECGLGELGYALDLYFGGQCPSPQDMTCCYKNEKCEDNFVHVQ